VHLAGLQILFLVYGAPARVDFILDSRFCGYTQDSGAFCLLRSDVGLLILPLCAGFGGIVFTSKKHRIADFVAIRRIPGNLVYFEMTSDCRLCRYTQDSGAVARAGVNCCSLSRCYNVIWCAVVLWRPQECPGEPRRMQGSLGEPGRAQ
jgi:hypothetical protein